MFRLNYQGFLDSSFSVARYAESSQALVSYWRIPGRRLRNFAWLHVEPRPVPELAWGGEFGERAVCRSRPRRADLKLLKNFRLPEALRPVVAVFRFDGCKSTTCACTVQVVFTIILLVIVVSPGEKKPAQGGLCICRLSRYILCAFQTSSTRASTRKPSSSAGLISIGAYLGLSEIITTTPPGWRWMRLM